MSLFYLNDCEHIISHWLERQHAHHLTSFCLLKNRLSAPATVPPHLLWLLRECPYLLSVSEATPAIWKRHSKKDESVHYKKANIPNNLHAYGIAFVSMLFRG